MEGGREGRGGVYITRRGVGTSGRQLERYLVRSTVLLHPVFVTTVIARVNALVAPETSIVVRLSVASLPSLILCFLPLRGLSGLSGCLSVRISEFSFDLSPENYFLRVTLPDLPDFRGAVEGHP